MCIFLVALFSNVLVSLRSVFCDVQNLKTLGVHAPDTPKLAPAVIVTRPDERGKQAGTLQSGISKGCDRPVL